MGLALKRSDSPITRSIQSDLSVTVVRDAAGLSGHVPAWERLCASSPDRNVFYEPWMLLPAIEQLGAGVDFYFVLVYATTSNPRPGRDELVGFFPLHLTGNFRGFPVKHFRLWQHQYCFLCTPLVSAVRHGDCLAVFFDWLATAAPPASWMKFNWIDGDGEFSRHLHACAAARQLRTYSAYKFNRALFRHGSAFEDYLKQSISGDHLREIRRKEKHLQQQGRIEYRTLDRHGNVEAWLAQFIELEASGWKGREGSALNSDSHSRAFFLQVIREAFRNDRLIMQGLFLEGKPVAQYCALKSGQGAFAFKRAYDEAYARYSPGMLLEIERLRHLCQRQDIAWVDSCASSDSFHTRLWRERKVIESLLCPTGRSGGVLLLRTLAYWKQLRLLLKRHRAA